MNLPKNYQWLLDESGPRILLEFLKIFGTEEDLSENSNPTILYWANTIGLDKIYKNDRTAWCGLAMAYVAGQAGWDMAPQGNALWALNWQYWGSPSDKPMLGDVLVFVRPGGGHVGVYVAEDKEAFHVLGGNQDDRVSIKRIAKSRLRCARRCEWRINQPANVRQIVVSSGGKLSLNEV